MGITSRDGEGSPHRSSRRPPSGKLLFQEPPRRQGLGRTILRLRPGRQHGFPALAVIALVWMFPPGGVLQTLHFLASGSERRDAIIADHLKNRTEIPAPILRITMKDPGLARARVIEAMIHGEQLPCRTAPIDALARDRNEDPAHRARAAIAAAVAGHGARTAFSLVKTHAVRIDLAGVRLLAKADSQASSEDAIQTSELLALARDPEAERRIFAMRFLVARQPQSPEAAKLALELAADRSWQTNQEAYVLLRELPQERLLEARETLVHATELLGEDRTGLFCAFLAAGVIPDEAMLLDRAVAWINEAEDAGPESAWNPTLDDVLEALATGAPRLSSSPAREPELLRLVEGLLSARNPRTASLAARVLGAWPTLPRRSILTLKAQLGSDIPARRCEAVAALGRQGGLARRTIEQALNDPTFGVKVVALRTLSRDLHDELAVTLRQLFRDGSADLRAEILLSRQRVGLDAEPSMEKIDSLTCALVLRSGEWHRTRPPQDFPRR